ncbi:unnamed protein product [Arabis nemorensis]|uniref:Uncharacterized protein n=1 Tax=Arabis nemorensis TaxID=586526 RepID=A0A565AU70_9BRAS|nr:unnamed protein product [Arabis nemorensis]
MAILSSSSSSSSSSVYLRRFWRLPSSSDRLHAHVLHLYPPRTTTMISTSQEDIDWVKDLIRSNGLHMQDNVLRKGINPRTRYKGISHYEGDEATNHTALPCLGELLVEEHHSNYGEPWAGGRDVFEFLAEAANL